MSCVVNVNVYVCTSACYHSFLLNSSAYRGNRSKQEPPLLSEVWGKNWTLREAADHLPLLFYLVPIGKSQQFCVCVCVLSEFGQWLKLACLNNCFNRGQTNFVLIQHFMRHLLVIVMSGYIF